MVAADAGRRCCRRGPGPRSTHWIALGRLPAMLARKVLSEGIWTMRTTSNSSSRARHLTVADVCDELGVARSTFYDWRAKGAAPRCFKLPNGEIRVRRVDLDAWLLTLENGVA